MKKVSIILCLTVAALASGALNGVFEEVATSEFGATIVESI